jgi:hypothetical protein
MKTYISLGIALALALVIGRYVYHHYQQDAAMDAYVDARLSQPFSVPLDCPPLAKQDVTFVTDESDPETTKQNGPTIQMRWSEIWPKVYQGIQNETSDWKDEEKQMLGQKVEIKVDLPSKIISDGVSWQIEYGCAAGNFTTDMNGLVVGQTQID